MAPDGVAAPTLPLLSEREWQVAYRNEDGDLVELFYNRALACAVQYDRLTGYFSANALALAARGIRGLITHNGKMRLVVGCTLKPDDVEAIGVGYDMRDAVTANLLRIPLEPPNAETRQGLELLAWMIAHEVLDVKVAVPVDAEGRPVFVGGIYHEKVGVLTDAAGNQIGFSGSINETWSGWRENGESFHVYRSWRGEMEHVQADAEAFNRVWENRARATRVFDVPDAVKRRLLEFLPQRDQHISTPPATVPKVEEAVYRLTPEEVRTAVWAYVRGAASMANGIRVGEATSAVEPWPHQLRTFQRFLSAWPGRLLIADEVGLGKTISAGLILRQAWLSGRARRILLLVPKAVMIQWQNELYEKFNLNVPIYDGGKLAWRATHAGQEPPPRRVEKDGWLNEPFVICGSQLMRRRERASMLEAAEGWDLILLDEAHHARRGAAGSAQERGPNNLLRLMQKLRHKSRALLLLTATPMQVAPVEVWDLLNLLGLPAAWTDDAFRRYFELAGGNPNADELKFLAGLFRVTEAECAPVSDQDAARLLPDVPPVVRRRVLRALRDGSGIPLRQLDVQARQAAQRILQVFTPIRQFMARQTRGLLRRYVELGLLTQPIATRDVHDKPIDMTPAEESLYHDVEYYISDTYNRAAPDKRTAIGFVMTIYRRRLASSFAALQQTLNDRLVRITRGPTIALEVTEEDVSQDEAADEAMDTADATDLAATALAGEEPARIKELLKKIAMLSGKDTKARRCREELERAFSEGFDSAIIFTQYADTMRFLRESLARELPTMAIASYSGEGGALHDSSGGWTNCSKEEIKRRLKQKQIRLLVATDAAGEGLNMQFCGVVVNYDLPWNPMKVEQRIGRIDRIGQKYPVIRVINLAYNGTVEADVYFQVGKRIKLFEGIVGKLQPILSRLPGRFEQIVLERAEDREAARHRFLADVNRMVQEAEESPFDIDAAAEDTMRVPEMPPPGLTLEEIDAAMNRQEVRPPALEWHPRDAASYEVKLPGMARGIRATTSADVFEYSENHEFLSPGGVLFEQIEAAVPEPTGPSTGPGVCWLVTGQDGTKRVVVMTTEGVAEPLSLWALMDALQRVASPVEFPVDRFPDAQTQLLA